MLKTNNNTKSRALNLTQRLFFFAQFCQAYYLQLEIEHLE